MAKQKTTVQPEDQPDPRALFINALADYLAGDQARMSIRLQLKDPDAQMWARLRGLTPLFGYPTVDEARAQLAKFLLGR